MATKASCDGFFQRLSCLIGLYNLVRGILFYFVLVFLFFNDFFVFFFVKQSFEFLGWNLKALV